MFGRLGGGSDKRSDAFVDDIVRLCFRLRPGDCPARFSEGLQHNEDAMLIIQDDR